MKIIDAHIHLGKDCVFDEEQTESEIIKSFDTHNIHGGIVQPFIPRMYVEDTMAIHDRIKKFCDDNSGRFYGMVSMNPHFTHEDYEKEATRCVKEMGFVAIKITPIAHACHPNKADARFVYETARKLNVPVMVHTGAGIPFSDPMSLAYVVEEYKDVTFVLAHAGSDMFCQQAIYLAKKHENVFLEPSWVAVINLKGMIKSLGCSKIMFSSDMLENLPVELAKYREAIQSEKDLEQVFCKTASSVFNIAF